MRERHENGAPPAGEEIVLRNFEEAQALSKLFHLTFPGSELNMIIGAERGDRQGGKWKIIFEGDMTKDPAAAKWIKTRQGRA